MFSYRVSLWLLWILLRRVLLLDLIKDCHQILIIFNVCIHQIIVFLKREISWYSAQIHDNLQRLGFQIFELVGDFLPLIQVFILGDVKKKRGVSEVLLFGNIYCGVELVLGYVRLEGLEDISQAHVFDQKPVDVQLSDWREFYDYEEWMLGIVSDIIGC